MYVDQQISISHAASWELGRDTVYVCRYSDKTLCAKQRGQEISALADPRPESMY